jgi:serine/threonine protein kinase
VPSDQFDKIGRYEVVSRLGRGGMGTVFLARDPLLERTLAIKVLSVDSAELRERFAREARSAARLRHPNIVVIYDIGEDREQPFIAMEYVNGESLAEIIRREAPLHLADKLRLIEELCAGLAYAHRAGIVHRDIKPANLVVSAEGPLKILDFGLARLTGASQAGLTKAGVMLGTPHFMSPEQVQGGHVDHRTDIYSAGVVMFELLTYQKPFNAESPVAVLHHIVSSETPSLRRHLPDADPELDRIVATAMARDPDRRYGSAELLLKDVEKVRTTLDSGAQESFGVPPTSQRPLRRPSAPSSERESILRRRALQVQGHLEQAQALFDAGDLEAARDAGEQALLLDPEEPRALDLLERIQAALEEREHRALEKDASVRAALALANARFDEAAFEAALRSANEALAFDPTNKQALELKDWIAAAISSRQPRAPAGASEEADRTVVAPMPAAAAAPAAPDDGTMFIPAMPSIAGHGAAAPRVRLVVLQSSDASLSNESFDVGGSFEIGRDGRDLRSSDLTWSRRHALIEHGDQGYTIRDLGSSGGTYVNGRRVRPGVREPLFFGARITIGNSVLTFSPSSATRLPDLTGTEVAGRYLLERLLRTSSKGAVYMARQKMVPLHHALKLLSPSLVSYPGYLERFKREAEVATELHHPHICDVQDFGETTLHQVGDSIHTVYLCLRLMAGGNLADRLDDRQPIPHADIARWVDRLADALGYAHLHEVVHGDLKPSAIVFDEVGSGNPYLTDFAIGQPREGDTSPGVIGTPAYMAPEQWDGRPSTPATDQFGLAALAYFMVTGVRPFEGQDHPEIRRRNFARGPLPAHEEAELHGREGVRPAVSRVLARGLALNPDERYPEIAAFAQDFAGALTGSNVDRDPAAKPRVFLSYRRAGGAGLPLFIVSRLREQHDIDVFLDVQRVDGAVRFPDRLIQEMRKADVFICLLGPSTLESHWVRHEILLARQQRKPMIPVFHEDYELPTSPGIPEIDELLSFDGIRLMDQQNLYVEEGIDKLARRIKDTLTRDRGT